MNPETAMEAATEGARALTKFQEIVEKFMGPLWTRKQADADAYADERKLQTIRDNPDMDIVYVDGQINARAKSFEALSARAKQRMLNEAARQQNNIEKVLEITGEEVQHAKTKSDELPDEDWLARFFNIVKDINSNEMQYIWGKILAGEIVAPSSFSLKALDTIRNMSRQDAEIFQRLSPLISRHKDMLFITSSEDILKKYDIAFSDVMALAECGLINVAGLYGFELTIPNGKQQGLFNNAYIIIVQGVCPEPVTIQIHTYSLTKVGQELFKVLEYSPNREYMLDLAKLIYEQSKEKLKLHVHKITEINDLKISYEHEPLAQFCINEDKG